MMAWKWIKQKINPSLKTTVLNNSGVSLQDDAAPVSDVEDLDITPVDTPELKIYKTKSADQIIEELVDQDFNCWKDRTGRFAFEKNSENQWVVNGRFGFALPGSFATLEQAIQALESSLNKKENGNNQGVKVRPLQRSNKIYQIKNAPFAITHPGKLYAEKGWILVVQRKDALKEYINYSTQEPFTETIGITEVEREVDKLKSIGFADYLDGNKVWATRKELIEELLFHVEVKAKERNFPWLCEKTSSW